MGKSQHPKQIGDYQIDAMIGRGAMGIVYAARKIGDHKQVALKTLQPRKLSGTVEAVVERFAHEVIAMNSLKHPGIVRVFDWDRADTDELGEVLFFAMELLQGETLETAVRRGPFFAPEACAIVHALAEALLVAHQQGIVHRDIKPANVFLTDKRQVVITDFGVCKLSNVRPVTTVGSFIGTAPFLAPEVVQHQVSDSRADIFSVGALFYNLLTRGFLRPISSIGELLFSITQGEEVNRVRQLKGFDQRIIDILAMCVEKDPERRFQSVADVAQALKALAGTIPAPGTGRAFAPVPETPFSDQDAVAYQEPATEAPAPTKKKKAERPDWLLDSSVDPMESAMVHPGQGLTAQQAQEREMLFDSRGLTSFTIDGESMGRLPSQPMMTMAGPQAGAKERVYLSQEAVLETGQGGGPDTAAFAYFGLTPEMVAFLDHRAALRAGKMDPDKPGMSPEAQASWAKAADQMDVGMLELDFSLDQKVKRPIPWRKLAILGVLAGVAALTLYGMRIRSLELPISSEPPGAMVIVDGEELGPTPVTLKTRRNKQPIIEVQAKEHETFAQQLAFSMFGEVKPIFAELHLTPATLQLRSTPKTAVVTVDSAAACKTPCTITSLTPKQQHLVALEVPGCAPFTFLVEAEPGGSLEHDITLQPLSAKALAVMRVIVDKGPLLLDGEDVTTLAKRGGFFVFAGKHLLEIGRGPSAQRLPLALPASSAKHIDLRQNQAPPPPPSDRDVYALVESAIYELSNGREHAGAKLLNEARALEPKSPEMLRGQIVLALSRDRVGDAQHMMQLFMASPEAPADRFRVQQVLDAAAENNPCE